MTSDQQLMLAVCALVAVALVVEPAARATAPGFEQHFAPAENLERTDVAALDGASRSIDMAAYVLTDIPVIEALTRAAGRGVRVRLYRQVEEYETGPAIANALEALERAGADIRFKDPTTPLMHLKAYCVDGTLLRVGAANFSGSGLKRQDNDLEIIRGPQVCAAFERAFTSMWEGK